MLVADVSGFVYEQKSGDSAQFEEIPFLPIEVGDGVLGVWQAGVGQVVFLPVTLKGWSVIGSDGEDFRVTRGERRILIP